MISTKCSICSIVILLYSIYVLFSCSSAHYWAELIYNVALCLNRCCCNCQNKNNSIVLLINSPLTVFFFTSVLQDLPSVSRSTARHTPTLQRTPQSRNCGHCWKASTWTPRFPPRRRSACWDSFIKPTQRSSTSTLVNLLLVCSRFVVELDSVVVCC